MKLVLFSQGFFIDHNFGNLDMVDPVNLVVKNLFKVYWRDTVPQISNKKRFYAVMGRTFHTLTSCFIILTKCSA